MNELSLFSGAGGGLLGSKLLGWRTIGYVEYEAYCQKIIKQRIADGILDAAPIFGDIRKFISDGYAEAYRGMVDIVTGGFPCQPFSVAGKQLGENDTRNMWPSTIECVRIIRPQYVFLENVPGLLTDKYMGRIFGDLAESGHDARWTCLGADDIEANHRRKRLWIFSWNTNHPINDKCQIRTIQKGREISNTQSSRLPSCSNEEFNWKSQGGIGRLKPRGINLQDRGWWKIEPDVGRVANGVASRVDRLKAIGNGQVPICMAYAFSILSQGIIE